MNSISKKFLTLGLLLPLAGCFDSGCCKKTEVVETEQAATPATPKENCGHVGCTHDHSKDATHMHENASEAQQDEVVVAEEVSTSANEIESDEK